MDLSEPAAEVPVTDEQVRAWLQNIHFHVHKQQAAGSTVVEPIRCDPRMVEAAKRYMNGGGVRVQLEGGPTVDLVPAAEGERIESIEQAVGLASAQLAAIEAGR